MWTYNTLAHAAKEGTRYGIVHGADCVQADSACQITVGQLASVIQNAGLGLDPARLSVLLATVDGTQNCAPLSSCLGSSTAWPASPGNGTGLPITVSGTYPFVSAIIMFLPHAGSVAVGSLTFGANSQEEIRYECAKFMIQMPASEAVQ